MASFDTILDLMRPQLGMAPPDVSLRRAALQAARQLCMESRCYRMPITIDSKAGYSRYKLIPNWTTYTDDDYEERQAVEVVGVKAVEVDGTPYDPERPESFSQRGGNGLVVIYLPDEIDVFHAPDASASKAIKVSAILRPKIDATVLPRLLVSMYAEEIAGGALATLKGMKNEPWSDPDNARRLSGEFRADVSIAKAMADRQAAPRGFFVRGYA